MKNPSHLLAVFDRSGSDPALLAKAVRLARQFGARLELFLCDAEHAYALKREYDSSHSEAARSDYIAQALDYLAQMRATVGLREVDIQISASCETPLYEGIVHKVQQSKPDLVLKNAGRAHSRAPGAFDPNDWQLMRKCSATLLITRGRTWHDSPRFAAAVDVSAQETAGLARSVLATSAMLSSAHGCETDVLYSEPADVASDIKAARAEALRKLAQQCHVDVNGVRMLTGAPEKTLPGALLEGHYDVLTLGALTHRPGVTTLVGTLTSRLVDAADCDFVLVKPDSLPMTEMKTSAIMTHGPRTDLR